VHEPDALVTTDWLADHLEDENFRVVDIRGYVKKTDLGRGRQRADYLPAREEYDGAHVPGAVYVDWTRDITDPDDPVPAQVAPAKSSSCPKLPWPARPILAALFAKR